MKWLVPVWLIGLLSATYADILIDYLTHDRWNIADWLINYSGGFTRRGLTGAIAVRLSSLTNLNPAVFIAALQMAAYTAFFGFSYRLLKREERLLPFGLLLISPVLFAFQLTTDGCHRKEILMIALFSWLIWTARTRSEAIFTKALYFSLALFPLLILSHEALPIYLPYFLIVLLWRARLTKARLFWCGALCTLSVAVFLAVCLSPRLGEESLAQMIHALERHGYPIDPSGAINWIIRTPHDAKALLADHFHRFHYWLYLLLLPIIALAYLPVASRLKAVLRNPLALLLISASLLGTIALCTTGVDWGRYIYIHAALLFLLTLLPTTPLPAYPERLLAFRWALVAAFFYGSAWCMPYWGITDIIPPKYVYYTNYRRYVNPFRFLWRLMKGDPSAMAQPGQPGHQPDARQP